MPQDIDTAFKLAAQGRLTLADLFDAAQGLLDGGEAMQAVTLYRLWIKNSDSPLAYAAYFNLGVTLSQVQDNLAAEQAYRSALHFKPDFIEASLNLGSLQERQGQPELALQTWRKTLEIINPTVAADRLFYTQTLNNLGRLLEIRKCYPEAENMLRRSLEIDPSQPNAITHWVHLRQKQCKWPIYSAIEGLSMAEMVHATSALATLSASGDPAVQLAAARRYVAEKVLPEQAVPLAAMGGYGHQRLRIGYLSSDFCSHAVLLLTAELFELHDRAKVEVYAFCWSREDGSPLRARVIKAMDHHIRIDTMGDEEAARCIRSHKIDILIDLHGLTLGARQDILSYRPAPVQMTYLGFPGSTALPCIDYVLADRFVLPPELAPFFTEKPLYLPNSFQVNDRQRAIGPRPSKVNCGLPEDAFIFCSFNNNHKFTPEVFACWMRILKRSPSSVLWLIADSEDIRETLWLQAEQHGLPRARLFFAGRVLPADYLARYQVADLFLDTLPFNAGTTASDALWAGLPLLTCAGATFSSRMAGSLLLAVDLPQLITYNLQDYEDQAVELAEHPERIAAMKQQLADNRLTYALFDSPRFVRDLEAVYQKVALPPASGMIHKEMGPVHHAENFSSSVQAVPGSVATPFRAIDLYHIAYSEKTRQEVPAGYRVLDNLDSSHNDWREYWPIRNFLLGQPLDEESYYGFFSPRFQEKTGLDHAQACTFIQAAGADTDVISFSPQADMGSFFLNVFEQEELFQPGFTAASEAFLLTIGMPLQLGSLVMDSRQIIFSNYFVARPAFWRDWLTVNEKLFAICEGPDSTAKESLVAQTTYPGSVQRKVFLMERIASLLLTINPKWRVRAYNTFACAWSASRLNQFKLEAVLSDALKIAMKEQGFHDYFEAFAALREKLR